MLLLDLFPSLPTPLAAVVASLPSQLGLKGMHTKANPPHPHDRQIQQCLPTAPAGSPKEGSNRSQLATNTPYPTKAAIRPSNRPEEHEPRTRRTQLPT